MKALVFPGQGSQSLGMGKALSDTFPAARRTFDAVDAALGEKLSTLMFEGPDSELTLTANAQPALMAVSLAVVAVLRDEAGLDLARDAAFVAGHSLGEYSALAAAGALDIGTTARLLRRLRGQAMQKAVAVGEGAMAAIIGVEPDVAGEIAAAASEPGSSCQVANDNGGGQVVVSGAKAAVDRAIEGAKARGIRRVVPLAVSAPFHCSLMQPAADAMATALAEVEIAAPVVPLVANVTAAPTTDPAEIRRLLVEQVTGTVRWRESMLRMAEQGVALFVECGSGKVLSGLVKRIVPDAAGLSVGTPADVSNLKAELFRVFDLTGKTALVTGASGGIGRAIAEALHAQGRHLVLSGTRREALDTLAGALGARTHVVPCDLADSAAVDALVPAAEAAAGAPLDILINNAGITRDNLFMRMSDAEWDQVIAVNLTTGFRLARACLKGMMRRRWGRIVAVTSVVGTMGNAGQANYAASKAGMVGMTKSLAYEAATRNVTANCIAPGFIETPMTDALNEKQKAGILGAVPMARLGQPRDVAAAAVFLASEEAAYVTGQTLHVNGGMAMI